MATKKATPKAKAKATEAIEKKPDTYIIKCIIDGKRKLFTCEGVEERDLRIKSLLNKYSVRQFSLQNTSKPDIIPYRARPVRTGSQGKSRFNVYITSKPINIE